MSMCLKLNVVYLVPMITKQQSVKLNPICG